MKKLVILTILLVSNIALAQRPAEAVKPLNLSQAREANNQRVEIKKYKEAIAKNNVPDAVRTALVKLLNDSISKVGGLDSTHLESLVSKRPEVLDKITQLISLAKAGTTAEQAKARIDLKILTESAKYEQTKEDVEILEKITEMAEYNESVKSFKEELIRTFIKGKARTIAEAINIASNGKIDFKKIKECII